VPNALQQLVEQYEKRFGYALPLRQLQESVANSLLESLIASALRDNEPRLDWHQLGIPGYSVDKNGELGKTSICSFGAMEAELKRLAKYR
jgi:hypothetical protein